MFKEKADYGMLPETAFIRPAASERNFATSDAATRRQPAVAKKVDTEKVIIIIPTYNEAGNIACTIDRILAQADCSRDFQIEILVFDSQSTDATAAIVQEISENSPRVHFVQELQKTGLGSAYLQAMRFAMEQLDADIVFEFDADGSHQPCYILPMLELLKNNDVAVGSRYVPGGSIPADWGINRKLLSVLGNWVARLFLTRKFKDLTSGLRATRTIFLKQILPDKFLSNHYGYKLQLYWLLYQARARIVEYPIVFVDREKGVSKLPKNSVKDTLTVLVKLRVAQMRQYFTMCCVGALGVVLQFILYNVLRSQHYPAFEASQLAIVAAMLSNFTLNHRVTFKQRTDVDLTRSTRFFRLAAFLTYSFLIIGLQSSLVHFFVRYAGSGALKENIIVAAGIGLGSIANYCFYSQVVWPRHCT